jgi:hypothetical protein
MLGTLTNIINQRTDHRLADRRAAVIQKFARGLMFCVDQSLLPVVVGQGNDFQAIRLGIQSQFEATNVTAVRTAASGRSSSCPC